LVHENTTISPSCSGIKRRRPQPFNSDYLSDADRDHLDGDSGVVAAGLDLGDLDAELVVLNHLSEDGVGRRSGFVEPVEERVVTDIDEKLGASGLGTSGVSHAQGSAVVSDPLVRLSNLVGNSTLIGSAVGLSVAALEAGARGGTAGSGSSTVGVLGVGASKLIHKVGDLRLFFIRSRISSPQTLGQSKNT